VVLRMPEISVQPNIDQKGKDSMDIIEDLLHQIYGQLCIIKMEATMPLEIRDNRFSFLVAIRFFESATRFGGLLGGGSPIDFFCLLGGLTGGFFGSGGSFLSTSVEPLSRNSTLFNSPQFPRWGRHSSTTIRETSRSNHSASSFMLTLKCWS
jgi:hypothetical protein